MQNERYNPGDLDTRITVLSVTQTRGDQGQKTKAASVYGDVFAQVIPTTDDFVSDDNYEALTTVSVKIYKIPALQTQWRLRIDGVEYEITGIDPISRWSPFCVLTARTISK